MRKLRKFILVLAALLATASSQALAACPQGSPIKYRAATVGPRMQPAIAVTVVRATAVPDTQQVDELLRLPVGTHQEIEGNFFGQEPGFVTVYANGLTIPAVVTDWDNNVVGFEVPNVGTDQPTLARIDVILPDGRVADSVRVVLVRRGVIRPRMPAPSVPTSVAPQSEVSDSFAPHDAATQGVSLKRS